MRFSISTFGISILPFIVASFCYLNGFEANTNDMLNLFMPLVWGILFALGGGVVYLNNHKFDCTKTSGKFLNSICEHTKSFSLVLIAHCLIFIALSIFYPARFFIKNSFNLSPASFDLLRAIGDAALFSSIMVPTLFSVVVGAFCLFLSFNPDHVIKK